MAGKSLNRVQLIGNLGKDPEIKYTPSGTPVAKLTIAAVAAQYAAVYSSVCGHVAGPRRRFAFS